VGVAVNCNSCDDLADNKGYFKKIKMFNKTLFPLVIIFLVTAAIILIFRNNLQEHGFDWQVLSGGNLFVYLVTVISMHLLNKGMDADNTPAFLRNAYSGIMVKLFACAAAAFIYILASGKNLNKPALFTCMVLYIVYTYVELSVILKHSNAKKNVKN
jgi:mannose/fructose/N-acetylgalactosamine-specific phosphotransferase system component IIC